MKRHGKPRNPADLDRHALLGFVRPSTGKAMSFLFRDPDGSPFEVSASARLRCAEDFLACVTLAREGAGIVQAYRFIVASDLATENLVELLPRYGGRTRPFSLLMPARGTPTLAVRTFADALIAHTRKVS